MVWDSLSYLSQSLLKKLTGTSFQDCDSDSSVEEMEDCRDDYVNGLCIKGKVIPVEVLGSILKWLDPETLVFSCRLVCKQWKDVVDDFVWEEKVHCTKVLLGPRSEVQIPWWLSYCAAKMHPVPIFNRNIIKNNCGQNQFAHWKIRQNFGDRWMVEKEPCGAMEPTPSCEEIGEIKCCFVTSFEWSSKDQCIKLSDVGLSDKIMDEIQPDFEYGDWITSRFDCGGLYVLNIHLLDKKRNSLCEAIVEERRLESGAGWEKVSGFLRSPYPTGARYIVFHHKGKDTQFWKGHYGIKITGSSLKPIFPKERFLANSSVPLTPTGLLESKDL